MIIIWIKIFAVIIRIVDFNKFKKLHNMVKIKFSLVDLYLKKEFLNKTKFLY